MATTSNILTLLKFYANKQKSAMVNYDDFADYIHRYAQHHLEENADLVRFLGSTSESLQLELNELVTNRSIVRSQFHGKEYIYVIPLYVEYFAQIYKRVKETVGVPFPNFNDIPKNVPQETATGVAATDIIYQRLDHETLDDKNLYSISLAKGVPTLLFPSSVPMKVLVDAALNKIQDLMHKEEVHDYFLKKLTISNPGKELSIKNFFAQFCESPQKAIEVLQTSGDTFYYWSQLCYFLKQDYIKVKDFTPEDINVLQSVGVIEVATSFYKSKTSERQQKESAFKVLEMQLANPPYYYNMNDISKFKDPNGVPLLGQYDEKELKEYLEHLTQDSQGGELPRLLIFSVDEGDGYFILKEKVMSLILRLSNDARVLVKESLVKEWYKRLLEWETLPEMKESAAFERCLAREVRTCDPVLSALLDASFLHVISFEDKTPSKISLFREDRLLPLSEILMLNRQEIYTDAKFKLPFWYTIPLISWIIGLIARKPGSGSKNSRSASSIYMEEKRNEEEKKMNERDAEDRADPKKDRKRQLRASAVEAEKHLVPESSSLDRELEGYLHEWNDRIGKQNFDNLTEDVNSLIRDYLRKVMRTLRTEVLTMDRISSLADSLCTAPSMMKIHNHPALKRYIELYTVKLLKNLP